MIGLDLNPGSEQTPCHWAIEAMYSVKSDTCIGICDGSHLSRSQCVTSVARPFGKPGKAIHRTIYLAVDLHVYKDTMYEDSTICCCLKRPGRRKAHTWYNKPKKRLSNSGIYSILGCVLPLQEVALRQSPLTFSVLHYPCPYRSLLPHNVISPTTVWYSH